MKFNQLKRLEGKRVFVYNNATERMEHATVTKVWNSPYAHFRKAELRFDSGNVDQMGYGAEYLWLLGKSASFQKRYINIQSSNVLERA